ncbi:S8 family serine peptidase [Xanthomonas hortorum pv. vitians]|uniref:S8 family serine peptidase n=1 Tax=Xanthomonas hortorum pv. vitians TaxID=83224 RepID=A0A6V7EGN7_9XANT|nr:S8 family serine peptidase [Xanthomonas hortorum]MCC4625802.1 S8 family serine peptidase [Xanthomonas campestris pv. nigromaculans]APP85222.1 serine protease [Xanthomonas hortorum pv. gardneri]ASW44849.1 serine protease [Xanthomonas hortorum]MCC8492950.1 S8 family serine peptidase [Xanthomonas hortorum pv. gardneri]MCE4282096.1 S8 family serine peptidase [Xanthomonas hortorum pv. vitians]
MSRFYVIGLIAGFIGLGTCTCVHAQDTPQHAAQAVGTSTAPAQADAHTPDSSRDILLAVANPLSAPPARAGSSLIGYASSYYGAGQKAAVRMEAIKQRYKLREVSGWPITSLGLYCAVLQPPAGVSRDELVSALADDEGVELVQPVQDFSVFSADASEKTTALSGYNDPYVDMQRGFIATDAASAQTITQGRGVVVAVVDTGVDTAHPDLKSRIRDVHDLVDDTALATSSDSHGTEVAGIIAAGSNNHQGIVGMAPKAMLSIYKACWYAPTVGATARCNTFTLAKALAAINNSSARVINLSLGGPADPLLSKMLLHLVQQGRIVVAAMPPNGRMDGFPNDVPGVLVVRSSSATAAMPGVLSAPGKDILTTQPNGRYDFTSGSSMATAHVSGMAALLLSMSPSMDATGLRELMQRTSKMSDGQLQVNAGAAVDALASHAKHSN